MSALLVALDFPRMDQALDLAGRLSSHVDGFKVGLELIMSEGPRAVSRVADLGLPVFADVKLHDIPNTVAGAARAIAGHGARWITVHAAGGPSMIEAACSGMSGGSPLGRAGVLVVTVLTSLDETGLSATGVERGLRTQVEAMSRAAAASGAEGVICSPFEAGAAKTAAPGLIAVTPGVRLAGDDPDDQKRVVTPEQAVSLGADMIVVGRSITRADDPVAVAVSIAGAIN